MDQQNSDSIIIYGTVWCPDRKRAKKLFGEQRLPSYSADAIR